jgi:hypothetical protein
MNKAQCDVKFEVMRRNLPGNTKEETKKVSGIFVKKRHFNNDQISAN